MEPEIYAIEGAPKTWREALEHTYGHLFGKGNVKDTYLSSIIKREETYPTGLAFSQPVAIPHTDPEHVKRAAICILRLAEPVSFGSMEEPEETVDAELVINLALESSKGQLGMLRSVMKLLRDKEWLTEAKTMPLEELRVQFGQRIGVL